MLEWKKSKWGQLATLNITYANQPQPHYNSKSSNIYAKSTEIGG